MFPHRLVEKIRVGIIDDETRLQHARAIAGITESDVQQILANVANDMATLDAEELRDFLRGRIDKIVMDPQTLNSRIHYQIPAVSGDRLASPRGLFAERTLSESLAMHRLGTART